MYTYPKSISEAAETLDKMVPDWYKKINVNKIIMSSDRECILGQVFGDYSTGLQHFKDRALRCAADDIFGFSASSVRWIQEIRKRLNQPKSLDKILYYGNDNSSTIWDKETRLRHGTFLNDSVGEWYTLSPISKGELEQERRSLIKGDELAKLKEEREILNRKIADLEKQ